MKFNNLKKILILLILVSNISFILSGLLRKTSVRAKRTVYTNNLKKLKQCKCKEKTFTFQEKTKPDIRIQDGNIYDMCKLKVECKGKSAISGFHLSGEWQAKGPSNTRYEYNCVQNNNFNDQDILKYRTEHTLVTDNVEAAHLLGNIPMNCPTAYALKSFQLTQEATTGPAMRLIYYNYSCIKTGIQNKDCEYAESNTNLKANWGFGSKESRNLEVLSKLFVDSTLMGKYVINDVKLVYDEKDQDISYLIYYCNSKKSSSNGDNEKLPALAKNLPLSPEASVVNVKVKKPSSIHYSFGVEGLEGLEIKCEGKKFLSKFTIENNHRAVYECHDGELKKDSEFKTFVPYDENVDVMCPFQTGLRSMKFIAAVKKDNVWNKLPDNSTEKDKQIFLEYVCVGIMDMQVFSIEYKNKPQKASFKERSYSYSVVTAEKDFNIITGFRWEPLNKSQGSHSIHSCVETEFVTNVSRLMTIDELKKWMEILKGRVDLSTDPDCDKKKDGLPDPDCPLQKVKKNTDPDCETENCEKKQKELSEDPDCKEKPKSKNCDDEDDDDDCDKNSKSPTSVKDKEKKDDIDCDEDKKNNKNKDDKDDDGDDDDEDEKKNDKKSKDPKKSDQKTAKKKGNPNDKDDVKDQTDDGDDGDDNDENKKAKKDVKKEAEKTKQTKKPEIKQSNPNDKDVVKDDVKDETDDGDDNDENKDTKKTDTLVKDNKNVSDNKKKPVKEDKKVSVDKTGKTSNPAKKSDNDDEDTKDGPNDSGDDRRKRKRKLR